MGATRLDGSQFSFRWSACQRDQLALTSLRRRGPSLAKCPAFTIDASAARPLALEFG
jgi:hypothetical protein